jgi:hypothetical protein
MVARLAKALRTSSKELKKIKDAADKVKKSKPQPATQKGLKLSKRKDIKMPDREIETPVVVGRTGITKTGEKINVGTPEDITRTLGSKKHAERKVLLESKKDKGTASKSELAELAARRKADAEAFVRQTSGKRTSNIPKGEYVNIKTGEIVTNPKSAKDLPDGMNAYVKDPTPKRMESIMINAKERQKSKFRKETEARVAEPKSAPKSTGSAVENKRRIGTNDYRKGGYVLSSVDNRKKRK